MISIVIVITIYYIIPTDLAFKITFETLKVVVGVDVGVEGVPGGGGEGAEVALVDQTLLVRRQAELVLPLRLVLQVTVHGVPVGHNTRGVGLGLPVVKNSVVEDLERIAVSYFPLD